MDFLGHMGSMSDVIFETWYVERDLTFIAGDISSKPVPKTFFVLASGVLFEFLSNDPAEI